MDEPTARTPRAGEEEDPVTFSLSEQDGTEHLSGAFLIHEFPTVPFAVLQQLS